MRRSPPRWTFRALALCAVLSGACAQPGPPAASPANAARPSAAPWPEGNALFARDPSWVGADSAYSLALDARRVLWLFGDTFIDPAADGSRVNGPNFFVRNSVAIQTGDGGAHDASRDAMKFYWGPVRDGAPSSFFHDVDGPDHWLWPLAGVRLPQGPLLLFRMHVQRVPTGFGFEEIGWDAIAVDDPRGEPSAWQWRLVQPLSKDAAGLVGVSALVHDGSLFAYQSGGGRPVRLARWSLAALGRVPAGALARPEWYAGEAGFVVQSESVRPVPLFEAGQTELSVHYDRTRRRFVEVQMRGLLLGAASTQLVYRTAPQPWGPWSALVPLWTPSEAQRPDAAELVAYAGKAHAEQAGPGLVVSYVVNDPHANPPADALYYPRLLRVQLP